MDIIALPNDILILVLENLSLAGLSSVSCTCRSMHALVSQNVFYDDFFYRLYYDIRLQNLVGRAIYVAIPVLHTASHVLQHPGLSRVECIMIL